MFIPLIDPHPRSRPGDGFVSRHLNRWISSCIRELLLKRHISPNQVSLVIALLAIPMILLGAYGHLILAAGLWQLISALDGIDGEIARAKGLGTRFGALLDTTLDYIIDSVGVLAIGLAVMTRSNVSFTVILSIVSIAITARLTTNFVVKSIPKECRHRLLPENRCIMVLIVLLGAIAAELTGRWVILATLLFISAVRIANCVYRMFCYYVAESKGNLEMPQVVSRIDSGLVAGTVPKPAPASPLPGVAENSPRAPAEGPAA